MEILKRAKTPEPNLSKTKKRTNEELKLYDIVFLNADKGNNTVEMDKLEYVAKLKDRYLILQHSK